jgi:hypothetical protein
VSDGIITGIVAILVCIINNWVQYNKTRQETDKTVALIKVKLDELSDRVDKHNQLVERTYHLESETALLNERLKIMEGKSA